jgi:hypothetical protein
MAGEPEKKQNMTAVIGEWQLNLFTNRLETSGKMVPATEKFQQKKTEQGARV